MFATSVVFGGAHLGPLLTTGKSAGCFIACNASTWCGRVCCSENFAERLSMTDASLPITSDVMDTPPTFQ